MSVIVQPGQRERIYNICNIIFNTSTARRNIVRCLMGVFNICWKEAKVEKGWYILAMWLNYFPAELGADLVHIEITALGQESLLGGTSETCHNYLGGDDMLASVTHIMEILAIYLCMVTNYVPGWIQNAAETEECEEMAAVKKSNHTHVVDDIRWCVSQMDCLCWWQFEKYSPLIANCQYGNVARQIDYPMDTCVLSWVEKLMSPCPNKDKGVM